MHASRHLQAGSPIPSQLPTAACMTPGAGTTPRLPGQGGSCKASHLYTYIDSNWCQPALSDVPSASPSPPPRRYAAVCVAIYGHTNIPKPVRMGTNKLVVNSKPTSETALKPQYLQDRAHGGRPTGGCRAPCPTLPSERSLNPELSTLHIGTCRAGPTHSLNATAALPQLAKMAKIAAG